MFETTLDILYFVLACSVGLLSVFLIILAVYLIGALSKANRILKEVEKIGEMFLDIKKRLGHSASHLGLIAEAVKHIVLHFIEGKIEVKRKKKKRKK